MRHYQGADIRGQAAAYKRLKTVPAERGVGLHHRAGGQIGHLALVRRVYVGNQVPQPQKRLDNADSLLAGLDRRHGLRTIPVSPRPPDQPFAVGNAPRYRRQGKTPAFGLLGRSQIPGVRAEFRQMPVARSGNQPIPAEEVDLHPFGGAEILCPFPLDYLLPLILRTLPGRGGGTRGKTRLRIPRGKPGVAGKNIDVPPRGPVYPGKMVNPQYTGGDFLPPDAALRGKPFGFQRRSQQFLCAKHLVAAAERFYCGEFPVQRAGADRHGIGVVDYPCVRGVFPHGAGDLPELGDGPQGADKAAGPGGIAHGLVDSVLFRQVHVNGHFLKAAG